MYTVCTFFLPNLAIQLRFSVDRLLCGSFSMCLLLHVLAISLLVIVVWLFLNKRENLLFFGSFLFGLLFLVVFLLFWLFLNKRETAMSSIRALLCVSRLL